MLVGKIRIAVLEICFLISSVIIGLNIYSDYRSQLLWTFVIFLLVYCTERSLIKERYKRYRKDELIISIIFFVTMIFFGLIIVFILNHMNWSKVFVRTIITKSGLNLTSGVLVAMTGYILAKYFDVGENESDIQ